MWRTISENPDKPMSVLFYSASRVWYSFASGNEVGRDGPFSLNEPYRCERTDIGYWDGETWRSQGTGHEIWEWPEDDDDPANPTHWMPLPEPPKP